MATEPTGQQIIAGGERVPVVFRDGTTREVTVSQLRPSQLEAYLAAEVSGELGPIGLVTGLTPDELDDLTLPSLEALLEADVRQNFSYARRYEKRRAAAALHQLEALRLAAPEQFDRIMAALDQKLSPSPVSSPVSPPPAAAGAPPPR